MENKNPIKAAAYIRVGNASQLTHKAAIYARCNHKDEMAMDWQLNKLREYAKQNNYEVVNEYQDFGCAIPTERFGMASLLTDAVKGNVDTLLLTDFDRLSRKTEETLAIADILDNAKVEIVSINNSGADMHTALKMFRNILD